jgi:hypothetical protein
VGKDSRKLGLAREGCCCLLRRRPIFSRSHWQRLGYRTVVYAEWDARWHRWIDRFGVMKPEIIANAPKKYAHKLTVVGDLMADVGIGNREDLSSTTSSSVSSPQSSIELIGLLPGSKSAKLAQGVPLTLAIAQHIHSCRPQTRFVIPVAPTLDFSTLARFADPGQNPLIQQLGWAEAELVILLLIHESDHFSRHPVAYV